MARIHIEGTGQQIDIKPGQSLLDGILNSDLTIATACGGIAACGLCRIEITDGLSQISEAGEKERKHIGDASLMRGQRLACQTRPPENATLTIRIPSRDDAAARLQAKSTRMLKQQRERRRQEQQARTEARSKRR